VRSVMMPTTGARFDVVSFEKPNAFSEIIPQNNLNAVQGHSRSQISLSVEGPMFYEVKSVNAFINLQ